MTRIISKVKNFFNPLNNLREEAIETCIKNEIPLTEDNILNVIEMIKFNNERKANLT